MLSASAWPEDLFTGSVSSPSLRLVGRDGADVVPLQVGRWRERPSSEELAVLARCTGPVLDVGCGPGRHVVALIKSGQAALGIDVSAAAVRVARRRGAPAVPVSVFADVPAAGCWRTALLLDGNVGIGGDPLLLLRRIHELLSPAGTILLELDPPGVTPGRFHAWVEHGGRTGPRFPWARVGPAQLHCIAPRAGFEVREIWHSARRWFAQLDRRGGRGR
jgi:SAM-dependent methyltransferase